MSLESTSKFSVGVSVLVVRDGRLLLGRRKNTGTLDGYLSTPGGRIEQNENRYEAAARELKEETGLDNGPLFVVGFKEHFRDGKHNFIIYLYSHDVKGQPKNMEPNKCEGWEWVEWNNIPLGRCTEPPDILDVVRYSSNYNQ